MDVFSFSFALLVLLTIAAAWFGVAKYGSPINPLTAFCVTTIGMFTVVSSIVASFVRAGEMDAASMAATLRLASLYLVAAVVPFLFSGPAPARLFGTFMRVVGLTGVRAPARWSTSRLAMLLLGALLAFALLALAGGGGVLWVSNPRVAYFAYRSGAGQFWTMTQWFLSLAFLYFLWSRRPTRTGLLSGLALFGFLAYFTGSKNNILALLVTAVAYYHFRVRPLRAPALALVAVLGLATFLGLLVLHGAYADVFVALGYFNDYFATTASFVGAIDDFGYQYGRGLLSSLWFYVPRGLYPDKPYEYGATLIHGFLYPGAAERGHTPGFLSWTPAFMDFGFIGVAVAGAIQGLWRRMAFEYYLQNRDHFFAFLFMVQITLWPVLTFAPLAILLVISIALSFFFRLVWTARLPAPAV
jgi:hypothetical protein